VLDEIWQTPSKAVSGADGASTVTGGEPKEISVPCLPLIPHWLKGLSHPNATEVRRNDRFVEKRRMTDANAN